MDFTPPEIPTPSSLPTPTASSPSILLANIILVCFTPVLICGFAIRHYILRPKKLARNPSIGNCGQSFQDPAAISIHDEDTFLSRIRLRQIYLVKFSICLFLTLAGIMEILKPGPAIDSDLAEGEDGLLSFQATNGTTVENLNKCIGWFGLISVGSMYLYIVIQLLPPRFNIRNKPLLALEDVSRAQLKKDANATEIKVQDVTHTASLYFWLKIPVFIPLIILVLTLRALLITTKLQGDLSSEFDISPQSVRLATKIFSLILDLMLLIWILFITLKVYRTIPSSNFTLKRSSGTSFEANPCPRAMQSPCCNHPTPWCRRVGSSKTRRKVARVYRSWDHNPPLASSFNSPPTSISMKQHRSFLKPAKKAFESPLKNPQTRPTSVFTSFNEFLKNIRLGFLSGTSRNENGEMARPQYAGGNKFSHSWAFVAACTLKSPIVVSQIIGIACCIISLASVEDRGDWRESKLMDSLVSGAIGYEGSIGYLVIVVISVLRIYLVLIEPVGANLYLDARHQDPERCHHLCISPNVHKDVPHHYQKGSSSHHYQKGSSSHHYQKGSSSHHLNAQSPITLPTGRKSPSIRATHSIPNNDSSRYMNNSQSPGSLTQSNFDQANNIVAFNPRVPERSLSDCHSATESTTMVQSIKRVPVPTEPFHAPLEGSGSFSMAPSLEEVQLRRKIMTKSIRTDPSMESSSKVSRQGFQAKSNYNANNCNSDEALFDHAESRGTGTENQSIISSHSSTHPLCRHLNSLFDGSDVPSSMRSPPQPPPKFTSPRLSGICTASDPFVVSTDPLPRFPSRLKFHQSVSQDSSGASAFGIPSDHQLSRVSTRCDSRISSPSFSPLSSIIQHIQNESSWDTNLSKSSQFLKELEGEIGMSHTSSSDSRDLTGYRPLSQSSLNTHWDCSFPSDLEDVLQTQARITKISEARPSVSLCSIRESISANATLEVYKPEETVVEITRHTLSSIDENEEFPLHEVKDNNITNAEEGKGEKNSPFVAESSYNRPVDSPRHAETSEKSENWVQLERSQDSYTKSKTIDSPNDISPDPALESPLIKNSPLDQELSLLEISGSVKSNPFDLDDVSRLHRKLSNDRSSLLGKLGGSTAAFLNFSSLPNSPTSASDFSRSHFETSSVKSPQKIPSFQNSGRLVTDDHMFSTESLGGSTSASTVMSETGLLGYTTDIELDKLISSNSLHHEQICKPMELGIPSSKQSGTYSLTKMKNFSFINEDNALHLNLPSASVKKRTVSKLLTESVSQASQALSRKVVINVPLLGPISQKRSSQESFHCAGENAAFGNLLGNRSYSLAKTALSECDESADISTLETFDGNPSADNGRGTAPSDLSSHRRALSLEKNQNLSQQNSLSSSTNSRLSSECTPDGKDLKNKKQAKFRKYFENPFSRKSLRHPSKTPTTVHHTVTSNPMSLDLRRNCESLDEIDIIRPQIRTERSSPTSRANRVTQIWIPGSPVDEDRLPLLKTSSLEIPELRRDVDDEQARSLEKNSNTSKKHNQKYGKSPRTQQQSQSDVDEVQFNSKNQLEEDINSSKRRKSLSCLIMDHRSFLKSSGLEKIASSSSSINSDNNNTTKGNFEKNTQKPKSLLGLDEISTRPSASLSSPPSTEEDINNSKSSSKNNLNNSVDLLVLYHQNSSQKNSCTNNSNTTTDIKSWNPFFELGSSNDHGDDKDDEDDNNNQNNNYNHSNNNHNNTIINEHIKRVSTGIGRLMEKNKKTSSSVSLEAISTECHVEIY